jgi:hypothetical protein
LVIYRFAVHDPAIGFGGSPLAWRTSKGRKRDD